MNATVSENSNALLIKLIASLERLPNGGFPITIISRSGSGGLSLFKKSFAITSSHLGSISQPVLSNPCNSRARKKAPPPAEGSKK